MLKFYNFYLLNVSSRSNCLARVVIDVFLSVIWMIYKDVLYKECVDALYLKKNKQ